MIDLTDKINVVKASEYDSWGIEIHDTVEKDIPCKIMYSLKQEEMTNADGEAIRVQAKVYFEGLYKISFGDKLNFVDDFDVERTTEILDIKPIKDFSDEILFTRVVM